MPPRKTWESWPEFLTTNGEGRGFNPAVSDASNCPPSRAPRLRDCAGRETVEGMRAGCGGVETPPFRSSGSYGLVLPLHRVELFLELELELFLDCPLVLFCGMPCLFQRLTLLVAQ